tara:strand:- start:585 stop:848 length:264 start_codon:yes stop_codon:yes gene_type:complete
MGCGGENSTKMVDSYCHDLLGVDFVQTYRHSTPYSIQNVGEDPMIAFILYRLAWWTYRSWQAFVARLSLIVPLTVILTVLAVAECAR